MSANLWEPAVFTMVSYGSQAGTHEMQPLGTGSSFQSYCGRRGGNKNQSAMPKGNYSYGGARVYQRLPRLTDTQYDAGPLNKTKTL